MSADAVSATFARRRPGAPAEEAPPPDMARSRIRGAGLRDDRARPAARRDRVVRRRTGASRSCGARGGRPSARRPRDPVEPGVDEGAPDPAADLEVAPSLEVARQLLRRALEGRFLLTWYAEVEVSFLERIFGGRLARGSTGPWTPDASRSSSRAGPRRPREPVESRRALRRSRRGAARGARRRARHGAALSRPRLEARGPRPRHHEAPAPPHPGLSPTPNLNGESTPWEDAASVDPFGGPHERERTDQDRVPRDHRRPGRLARRGRRMDVARGVRRRREGVRGDPRRRRGVGRLAAQQVGLPRSRRAEGRPAGVQQRRAGSRGRAGAVRRVPRRRRAHGRRRDRVQHGVGGPLLGDDQREGPRRVLRGAAAGPRRDLRVDRAVDALTSA